LNILFKIIKRNKIIYTMISKEEIIEKVGGLLKELSEKFEYISSSEKNIHPLEFQLFEVNAAYFAEHTTILRKLEEETANNKAEADRVDDLEHGIEKTVSTRVIQSSPPPVEDQVVDTPLSKEDQNESDEVVFTPPISDEVSKEENLDSQETTEEIPEVKDNSNVEENQLKEDSEENPKEDTNEEESNEVNLEEENSKEE